MPVVRATQTVAVRDPEGSGGMSVIAMDKPYDSNDPLVRAYPWAFEADVEQATAAPGEKRSVRKA